MRKTFAGSAVFTLFFALSGAAQQTAATARTVNAANAFLASLDDTQRKSVLYEFGDNQQRARWSNFPTGVVPRGGINFRQMTAPQQQAAMSLLATVLSPMGLEKVEQIRQADDDFKTMVRGGVEVLVEQVGEVVRVRSVVPARPAGQRESAVRVVGAGVAADREAVETCLGAICTTFRFSVNPPPRLHGCFNSADITLP